jgi:hypothetical protein
MELFRDPTWQFVGAAIAILALLVGFFQRRRKRLSYQLVSKTALLTRSEEIAGRLSVRFESREVHNVFLKVIRIKNHGNVPIESKDFETPLALSFGSDAEVLSVAVVDQRPDDLTPALNSNGGSCFLAPLLLNPGDYVTVKILVSGTESQTNVAGRVVGVTKVHRLPSASQPFPRKLMLALPVMTLLLGALTIFDTKQWPHAVKESLGVVAILSVFFVVTWMLEHFWKEVSTIWRQ